MKPFHFTFKMVEGEGYIPAQQLWDFLDHLAVMNPAFAESFLNLRNNVKEKVLDPIERMKLRG